MHHPAIGKPIEQRSHHFAAHLDELVGGAVSSPEGEPRVGVEGTRGSPDSATSIRHDQIGPAHTQSVGDEPDRLFVAKAACQPPITRWRTLKQ